MKSPSVGSVRMDYKEKTAEFEGEDVSQNPASDKKKPTNRPVFIRKNKISRIANLNNDDFQVLVVPKSDVQKLSQFLGKLK